MTQAELDLTCQCHKPPLIAYLQPRTAIVLHPPQRSPLPTPMPTNDCKAILRKNPRLPCLLVMHRSDPPTSVTFQKHARKTHPLEAFGLFLPHGTSHRRIKRVRRSPLLLRPPPPNFLLSVAAVSASANCKGKRRASQRKNSFREHPYASHMPTCKHLQPHGSTTSQTSVPANHKPWTWRSRSLMARSPGEGHARVGLLESDWTSHLTFQPRRRSTIAEPSHRTYCTPASQESRIILFVRSSV